MKRLFPMLCIALICSAALPVEALARKHEKARQEVLDRGRGYYKDIFMDSGISLTSRHYLPSARYLGLSIDYFASATTKKLSQRDTLLQNKIFCGSEDDTNGWLLYPDGAPRFRMIYVNGGAAAKHARSLGAEGQGRIKEFVKSGGGYLGTCAGAYMGSKGTFRNNRLMHSDKYLGVWPGAAIGTRLLKSSTTLDIERGSALSRYFDFGKDRAVEKVRHNGGCYACTKAEHPLPKGTEPLARYRFDNTEKVKIDGEMAIWGYKADENTGRVILCGSHPEGVVEGERVQLTAAMLLYAMDGNPAPKIKGKLKSGEVREMNKRTEDNAPEYTRIGDRQYHHFVVDVPRKCKQLKISLDGYDNKRRYDLTLCAKRGEFAFHDNTLQKVVSRGCKKSLVIENPKAGRWYISVLCETTIVTGTNKYGTYIRANKGVLNGVPYKISIAH